ncbi:MAG: acetyl-CoA acetyltransferase [Hyphomonadaceae bacterium]
MSDRDAERIPVLIGAGQVNDRAATGADGLDSLGLMIAAAGKAAQDAGGDLLGRVDWLGVVSQISFPEYSGKLVDALSRALAITPRHAVETEMPTGDSPILLINQAANAIGRGEAQVALIVGAEALRTASKRAQEAAAKAGEEVKKTGPLPKRKPTVIETRHRYRLMTPTDVYPLYENAGRASYGQSLAQGQAESAQIWSLFSRVAAENEAAWLRQERSSADILEQGADNRPIAFPYNKLMVANAAVNQGAAVMVTSLAVARAVGVPEARIIYVGKGAAAHEDDNPLLRADFATSASMRVSLTRALELNQIGVADIDHIELYSCFPCVPKMARRVIGWPAEKPATVFGGLTFGGGPIGNYMTHAAASMIEKLRESGVNGVLFANGGFATHNHTILFTKRPQPAGTFPHEYDFQAEADAARGAVPELDESYEGAATIETYTVIYDRTGAPAFGVVIGRAADGRRVIGRVPAEDTSAIELLTSGAREPVGLSGRVSRDGEINRWTMAA